jgi:hypothetical protein
MPTIKELATFKELLEQELTTSEAPTKQEFAN